MTSTAFSNGGEIPTKYTCDGSGTSPPLAWSNVPAGTGTLAVVVDDPDAPHGTFAHWVLFDVPAATTSLAENAAAAQPAPGAQGKNGAGRTGWMAPCPPKGVHHYHFKVFALRDAVSLKDPTENELLRAIQSHVVGQGEIVGTYEHRKK